MSNVKFIKNAAKGPHINSGIIGDSKYNFGSTIKTTLNVGVNLLVFETARAKVDYLDARLVYFAK